MCNLHEKKNNLIACKTFVVIQYVLKWHTINVQYLLKMLDRTQQHRQKAHSFLLSGYGIQLWDFLPTIYCVLILDHSKGMLCFTLAQGFKIPVIFLKLKSCRKDRKDFWKTWELLES